MAKTYIEYLADDSFINNCKYNIQNQLSSTIWFCLLYFTIADKAAISEIFNIFLCPHIQDLATIKYVWVVIQITYIGSIQHTDLLMSLLTTIWNISLLFSAINNLLTIKMRRAWRRARQNAQRCRFLVLVLGGCLSTLIYSTM